MKSFGTPRFWEAYAELPARIKKAARKQYQLWQSDPRHSSLQFKQIDGLWSIRVTQDYRALALYDSDAYYWIWIGTHSEYDQILRER